MKLITISLLFAVLCLACNVNSLSQVKVHSSSSIPSNDNSKICTEDQFECGTYSYYPQEHTMALSKMSYDFTGKQLYMDVCAWDYINDRVEENNVQFIAQFSQKKLFVIDENDNCKCHDLSTPMRRFCVPSDFEESYSFTFGRDLECEGFIFTEEYNDEINITINVIFTKEDRIPIQFSHYSAITEGVVEFFNVTSGIADPSIFDVPEGCDCDSSDVKRPNLFNKVLPHVFGFHPFKLFA